MKKRTGLLLAAALTLPYGDLSSAEGTPENHLKSNVNGICNRIRTDPHTKAEQRVGKVHPGEVYRLKKGQYTIECGDSYTAFKLRGEQANSFVYDVESNGAITCLAFAEAEEESRIDRHCLTPEDITDTFKETKLDDDSLVVYKVNRDESITRFKQGQYYDLTGQEAQKALQNIRRFYEFKIIEEVEKLLLLR